MIIILDLDNTLLNTSLYKEDLAKSLAGFGVSRKLFFKIYQKFREKNLYSHELYLKFLKKEKEIDFKKAKNKLEKIDKNFQKYLYSDTLWFLNKMRSKARLYLFSYGNAKLQRIKIKNSRISSFFEKIIVVEKSKLPSIKKIFKDMRGNIFFINDHPLEIKEVIKTFSNIYPIMIKRNNINKKTVNLPSVPVFSNLKEIAKYLRRFSE